MQLQKWTIVNRRWFSPESRPTRKQWVEMIRSKQIAGKILMDEPMIDMDHFAANDDFTPEKEVINLLD